MIHLCVVESRHFKPQFADLVASRI